MGSLGFWRLAQQDPEWIAAVDPDGTEYTAAELLGRSNRLVHALRDLGLEKGDGLCGLVPNGVDGLVIYLAALQAGWDYTPVNWPLTRPEIGYLRGGREANGVLVHERAAAQGTRRGDEAGLEAHRRISIGDVEGFRPYAEFVAGHLDSAPEDRSNGATMHYTSGTTGRPKGVKRRLAGIDPDDAAELMTFLLSFFGCTPGAPAGKGAEAHLITSPNYHTAVTQFGGSFLHLGHTVVDLDKWEAAATLRLIQHYNLPTT